MKRLSVIIILLIFAWAAYANSVDRRIRVLVDDLAKKYVLTQETLVSKKTVTLVEVKNVSPLAEKNYVGQAVAERIKTAIQDSLVFTYVDRELLEEVLEEIELSLSDITEGSSVEVGRIEEVELLLTGSVIDEGEDFLITLQLADVETTTLVAVSKTSFAKAELIEEGNRIAYAYVMANGIGAGLSVSPNYWFVYPQESVVEIGEGDKHALDMGAGVSYRLTKNIKLGLSFSFKQHDLVKDDRLYQDIGNIVGLDIGTIAVDYKFYQSDGTVDDANGYPPTLMSNQPIDYFLSQQIATIALTGAFVWPFTREFNLSVGAGPSINIINYVQHYDQILVFVNDGVGFQRRLYQNNFLGLGLKVDVGAEYFVLPRLSINAGLAYHLIFITNLLEVDASCPTTGDYYYSETYRAIDAFGLNPFELPDGTPLTYDLFSANYLKLYVGATFYF
jgi:TolB-like protein